MNQRCRGRGLPALLFAALELFKVRAAAAAAIDVKMHGTIHEPIALSSGMAAGWYHILLPTVICVLC